MDQKQGLLVRVRVPFVYAMDQDARSDEGRSRLDVELVPLPESRMEFVRVEGGCGALRSALMSERYLLHAPSSVSAIVPCVSGRRRRKSRPARARDEKPVTGVDEWHW